MESSKPKLLIITSNFRRHIHFANVICKAYKCGVILSEVKGNAFNKKLPRTDLKMLQKHFIDREEAEKKYFPERMFCSTEIKCDRGFINTEEGYNWLKSINPEFILLFGCCIIGERILNEYNNRVINLHLGLSPYYKGSGTNFWPIHDGNISCLGATIHLASNVVDGGEILHQTRSSDFCAKDNIHDLGCKTILAGIDVFPTILNKYQMNECKPTRQIKTVGKTFKKSDFNLKALNKAHANIESGIVHDYLQNQISYNSSFPINTCE